MLLKQLFSALGRTFGKGTVIDEDAFAAPVAALAALARKVTKSTAIPHLNVRRVWVVMRFFSRRPGVRSSAEAMKHQ